MRYLVIGAGVLGSLLTHALVQGKNDVSILARGERFQTLREDGLKIYHIKQKQETIDPIKVIDHLDPDDSYDVIFVVVQNSQLSSVLPIILANSYCKHIVLIGNNCDALGTDEEIRAKHKTQINVWFGFLHCGGSRKDGWVQNWHPDVCNFEIGAAKSGNKPPKDLVDAFSNTCLHVDVRENMDSWLKYHGVIVTPICLALKIDDVQHNSYFSSRALRLSIEAVKEGMEFLKREGYPVEAPHDMSLINRPVWLIQFLIALLLKTKTGHYIALDHALVAGDEMERLTKSLLSLASEHDTKLPCLNELFEHRIK